MSTLVKELEELDKLYPDDQPSKKYMIFGTPPLVPLTVYIDGKLNEEIKEKLMAILNKYHFN